MGESSSSGRKGRHPREMALEEIRASVEAMPPWAATQYRRIYKAMKGVTDLPPLELMRLALAIERAEYLRHVKVCNAVRTATEKALEIAGVFEIRMECGLFQVDESGDKPVIKMRIQGHDEK